MRIETIAIHEGNKSDSSDKAVIQPITLSTTFERGLDGSYPGGHVYTRASNPNRSSLENVVAKLERGVEAAAFSSGNAAGSAIFQALEPGSHIIAPEDMYHGLRNLLKEVYAGVLEVDFVDLSNLATVYDSIKENTKLIWIETPSNPLLKVTDIRGICSIAQEMKVLVCCDNTFATPVFQLPLALGADFVMHSSTKYMGGHSDVLGGILVTKELAPFWSKIRSVQSLSGAVPSPFDCYMTVRGIKTLPYRMRGHAENARKIASFLNAHPSVEKVYYPGLNEHEMHEIAASQMSDFGGMMSFTIHGSEAQTRDTAAKLRVFTQATSLGGVESLVEHRASVEGPDTRTPSNLLRLSVGLEHSDDLIADLAQALSKS